MKKILCMLAVVALLAGLLAGCGSQVTPPGDPTQAGGSPVNNNEFTFAPGDTPTDPPAPPPGDGGDGGGGGGSLGEAFSELNQLGQMFSAGWPDNQFTRQVPKPNFETTIGGVASETEFAILCTATIDQLKDYVKDLKKVGFTKDADETDSNECGIVVYSYKASNGKGYTVEIGSAMGINTLTITKD